MEKNRLLPLMGIISGGLLVGCLLLFLLRKRFAPDAYHNISSENE